MPTKLNKSLKKGDIVQFNLAGGGGYGPAKARPKSAVQSDLRDGLISEQVAAEIYGLPSSAR